MNTMELLARAYEWLLSHGHSYEDLADFQHYIARNKPFDPRPYDAKMAPDQPSPSESELI